MQRVRLLNASNFRIQSTGDSELNSPKEVNKHSLYLAIYMNYAIFDGRQGYASTTRSPVDESILRLLLRYV